MTLISAFLALALMPQSAPGVDDQKVAAAVERGVAWLKKSSSPPCDLGKKQIASIRNSDELLLVTFLHAGLTEEDPRVKALLTSVLAAPFTHT